MINLYCIYRIDLASAEFYPGEDSRNLLVPLEFIQSYPSKSECIRALDELRTIDDNYISNIRESR